MSKSVVITGASRGLGLALTRQFLEAGWQVYGLSRTRQYWKSALSQLPCSILCVPCISWLNIFGNVRAELLLKGAWTR